MGVQRNKTFEGTISNWEMGEDFVKGKEAEPGLEDQTGAEDEVGFERGGCKGSGNKDKACLEMGNICLAESVES